MVNNAVLQFTDRAFLAHESMASLEAVLPASMLSLIILGFFQSVVAYAGAFVAQYFGMGRFDMCRASYRAASVIAIASGVLVLAFLPFGNWIFETFSEGPDVIAREKIYFTIVTAGGVALFGQMAAQAYFTGICRVRLVFWVNVIGNLFNVALDPVLIFGWWGAPKLGIAGAAYATVMATALQWVILVFVAWRSAPPADKVPVKETLALAVRVCRFGIPSGLYKVLDIVSFTIFVFIAGKVGHVDQAVSNAAFSVNYLLLAPMEGFAIAAQTLVGKCRGRGDEAEAKRVGLRVVAVGLVLVAVLSLLVVVFHNPILSLFEPDNPADIARFHDLGFKLFLVMVAWQLFDATDVMLAGALKGAGDTVFVMTLMVGGAFLFWLPLVHAVSLWHNTMLALWSTMVVYVAVMCAGSLTRWLRGRWVRIKVV